MMRAALIATALVGSQGFNLTSDVDCSETGVSFQQPNLTKPNGAYVHAASICQKTCSDMVYCEHFTWHPSSETPGACYLFGNEATKIADATVISGPAACSNSTSNATAPVVPVAVTDAGNTAAAVSSGSSGGSTFPWLLVLAIVLIVCLVGACVGYSFMTQKKEKKKKSSRAAKITAAEEVEAPPQGGVQSSQMEPMPMYSTASYAAPSVQYQQVLATPHTYYYTSEGPMLYTEGVQLAPVDYQQPAVEYMQGQVQYVVEQPQV